MRTKNEILSRLDDLRQKRDGVDDLFTPVMEAVEQYFNGDEELTHDVQYTFHQVIQDAISRNTVYEKQELMPSVKTDYPTGYIDIRELFTGRGAFEEIMAIDEETLDAAYIGEDPSLPPIGNEYLESWLVKLRSARSEELAALGKIAGFCESGSYNNGLIQLFEPLGEIVSTMPMEDLAKQVYIERGYKEIIETFGLDIYIPTIA